MAVGPADNCESERNYSNHLGLTGIYIYMHILPTYSKVAVAADLIGATLNILLFQGGFSTWMKSSKSKQDWEAS